jgi:mannose-6-phosphate isomerase-like protein (cupin superfamily)
MGHAWRQHRHRLPAAPQRRRYLNQALASFTDIYSPRIIGRVNDYDIKIAHAQGEHVWHVHEHTDEFFLVLDGVFDIALRDDGGERTVSLGAGEVFVVPRGIEHKPSSSGGSVLMFEPSRDGKYR